MKRTKRTLLPPWLFFSPSNRYLQKVIFSVLCSGIIFTTSAQTWESTLVKFGSNGKLTYTTDANQNSIPDFSYSGYKNNDAVIPQVTKIITTLTPQSGDNTAYINNAIAAAASVTPDQNGIRGVIFLSKGNYQINGTIRVNVSGVILRGAGSSSDPNSSTILQAVGNSPAKRTVLVAGGGSTSGWSKRGNYQSNITDNFVKVGSREFSVASTAGLQVGDNIVIYSPCTSAWVNSVGGGATGNDPRWVANEIPLVFNRVIKAINGLKVTIDAPVFNHLNKSLAQAYIYQVERGAIRTQIGLENFRVDIRNWTNPEADENHAWEGVGFVQAEDCWAKNVVSLHFGHAGFRFNTAARITVDNCKALDPVATITPERRYNFNFEDRCTNILLQNCEANKGRHAYVSNGTSTVSGIVVLNCKAIDNYTSSEGHRKWTMGMLFDNFTSTGFIPGDGRVLGLYSRGDYGTAHGWSLAHSVAWNCRVGNGSITVQSPPTARNYVIGGSGRVNTSVPFPQYGTGYVEGFNRAGQLSPASLFTQQLLDRKGTTPPPNQPPTVSLTSPVNNTSFVAPASITINANATDGDGSISKVDFYNGSTLLSTDVTSPYAFTWSNVAVGNYTITARATDNNGAVTTSSVVSVTVTVPPCIPASASSDDGNVPAHVLDGNLSTRWSANGDGQFIQLCLETVQELSGIQIAFYSGNVRQSIFDVQTSLDGTAWTNALANVRSSGTSLALEDFTFTKRLAKYVKIIGHGNTLNAWNSYTEVKVMTGTVVSLPNKLPLVNLTAPLNNTSFNVPASITITANATDQDGVISKVEFYQGATLLAVDNTAPYTYTWSTSIVGSYSITARATDDSGAVSVSLPVLVSVQTAPPVNQLPSVSLTSPVNNASFNAPASIVINATASDSDGSISKVEFYNGATLLGTDNASPYTYTWSNVSAGSYSLTVKATDNAGATRTSSVVTVNVNTVNTNTCAGIPSYAENSGYVAGSKVQYAGKQYQCKPYPYTGWCNGAAWAYGPGTGTAWSDAWTLIGSCTSSARSSDDQVVVNEALMTNAPNPFVDMTNIEVLVAEAGDVSIKVYDKTGQILTTLVEGYLNAGTYHYTFDASGLKADLYLVKMNTSTQIVTRKIMKAE